MSVPPHLAELRILAEETPDMSLDVPGFEEPQKTEGPEGKKVLITRRVMQPGQDQLKAVSIELAGLPVIGPGRWYAVVIALVIAIGGILVGLQSLGRKGKQDELKKQTSEAKKLLLDEMVLLEKARKQDIIGPRTYEQTRRQILLALARLEQDEPRDKAQLAGKQPASA